MGSHFVLLVSLPVTALGLRCRRCFLRSIVEIVVDTGGIGGFGQ